MRCPRDTIRVSPENVSRYDFSESLQLYTWRLKNASYQLGVLTDKADRKVFNTCADPGIFFRGGPGQSDNKKSSDILFFLSSAYFTEVKWSISKKSIIFQGSKGGPTFSRGSNCLFPKETHITCDSDTLSPPSGSALVTPNLLNSITSTILNRFSKFKVLG